MQPDAVLIARPAIDFTLYLALTHRVLGYGIGRSADRSHRELADAERFLSCLAAFRDEKADAALVPKLLCHVSFSVFIAADERDLLDILECCAGMPFVAADTQARGVQAATITGTLAQWRDAVKSGSSPDVEAAVRHCFNKIHALFVAEGLNVWTDFRTREAPDHTFYLEDKRR